MRSSEIKLETTNNISLKCATCDGTNPRVLYISGKTWVKPIMKTNYSDSLSRIKNRMENRILNTLRKLDSLDSKFIFDFSLTPLNMRVGRAKFMTFNIFLRQKEDNVRKLKNISKTIDIAILPLIDEMVNDFEENCFELNLKKS